MTQKATCTVDGCANEHRARGLCNKHWQRVQRLGQVELPSTAPTPVDQRFWAHVDRSGDCWEWIGARNHFGYGMFNVHIPGLGWRPRIASRVAYELTHAPIADALVVRHKCDNPPCVNPAHLELGTHAQNMRDMRERRRSATGEFHSQARLSWELVRQIRRRVTEGESRASLARELGVSSTTVDNVAAEKTWKEASK